MVILKPEETGLLDLLEIIMDKGLVVDGSVRVNFGGLDLLTTKMRIILASLKTAENAGLDFPKGINFNTPAWRDQAAKQPCPVCGKESKVEDLKKEGCPWCGWNYQPNEE